MAPIGAKVSDEETVSNRTNNATNSDSTSNDTPTPVVPKMLRVVEDDIVITGIGGRYPEADNVNEFWEMLISGKELVTVDDRRWPVGKCKYF